MLMTQGHQAIIVGAGILGLASAYHLLRRQPGLDLLVVEKLAGPGRGDTAKSAAAFRDMFSSPVNRRLSQAAIAFYEDLEKSHPIGLKKIGYLWLATAARMAKWGRTLEAMARAGVKFQTFAKEELAARLPALRALDLSRGILGLNCGILEPARLTGFYEQEVLRLGGRLRYHTGVTGFSRDQARISGIRVGPEKILGDAVIIATGAWTVATLALAGLEVPLVPRKRQLFSIPAQAEPLAGLLATPGFNAHNLLPFTILPEGAYLRPAAASFILGYANPDQAPGLEEPPAADSGFYENRIRPQIVKYFPVFQGLTPAHAWAGHYDEHLPDSSPFVARLAGALVVAGSSGSGVMKADSLGRIVAAKFAGMDVVELADGGKFRVADIGLQQRAVPREEFVI